MNRKETTEVNRLAWNEAALLHQLKNGAKLREQFSVKGASCLDAIETERLVNGIGVQGKRIAQPCCNNGRELISLRGLGAGRCVGFDISDSAVLAAGSLAELAGVECEFVATDVYEIPEQYNGCFDLIYISVGALGWMPSIESFFQRITRLMDHGAWLFIYEMHPIMDMFDPRAEDPLTFADSYFREGAFVETDGLEYQDEVPYESKPQHWFHHTLSAIINAVIKCSVRIESFDEFGHDLSKLYKPIEESEQRPPMSYMLTGRKE